MGLSSTGCAVAAVSALSLVTFGPGTKAAVVTIGGTDFDRSLAAGATVLLLALSTWALLCIALSIAADKTTLANPLAQLITPGFLRRAVFLGAAGALAVAPVAAVNTTGQGSQSPARSFIGQSLDGLRLPDRPVGAAPAAAAINAAGPQPVRVEHGDTLWSIAARELGPGASTAEISTAVKRWYETNLSTIGPDPDLILPHQQLTPPTKESR